MPGVNSSRCEGASGSTAQPYHLVLTIGGTSYAIRRLAVSPRPETRAYRLVKRDGTLYDIVSTRYGPICDCPDYIFRRDGLDPSGCKHIKALVGSGLIDEPPDSTPGPRRLDSRS